MKIICVIPARLESSRLPKKMLHVINGKTLIQRSWESAMKVCQFDKVIIATDSLEIIDHIKTFTNDYMLTSTNHLSGTSRMLEVYDSIKDNNYDFWVNWQGDEPFLNRNIICDLLLNVNGNYDVYTLKSKIFTKEELFDTNKVKVVVDNFGKALYFSRLPIPYYDIHLLNKARNLSKFQFYKHIGIYMFSSKAILKLKNSYNNDVSYIEKYEKLEQLTFMYYGMDIKVSTTNYTNFGIDTIEDVKKLEVLLNT